MKKCKTHDWKIDPKRFVVWCPVCDDTMSWDIMMRDWISQQDRIKYLQWKNKKLVGGIKFILKVDFAISAIKEHLKKVLAEVEGE